MASADPFLETECPICMEYLTDPVTLNCGHNFCRGCITSHCDKWELILDLECPVCRTEIRKGDFCPNWQLANIVEQFKLISAKTAENKTLCMKHMRELRWFCKDDCGLMCDVCVNNPEHDTHTVLLLEEVSKEHKIALLQDSQASLSPTTALESKDTCCICRAYLTDPATESCGHCVCVPCLTYFQEKWKGLRDWSCPLCKRRAQRRLFYRFLRFRNCCAYHNLTIRQFCKEDREPVCEVCVSSPKHTSHTLITVEEAVQQYKIEICACLKILRKGKEEVYKLKEDAEKESKSQLEETKLEREKMVIQFQQMHQFLNEQEKYLLAQIEEVEREIARKMDEHLTKLSSELSTCERIIWDLEEECWQPPLDFLQDIKQTLQRFQKKEKFESPVASFPELKWKIWDFSDINSFLAGVKKQLKGTLTSGLKLQKVNVTLDPDTAHRHLILHEDHKSVKWGDKPQDLPPKAERFDVLPFVLGREGFTTGRHFWEVVTESEKNWAVGVARKSVRRKDMIPFNPEMGIWAVGKVGGALNNMSLSVDIKKIRVSLNCEGGQVSFFDADTAAPVFAFSAASFSRETLHPFLYILGKAFLSLSPEGSQSVETDIRELTTAATPTPPPSQNLTVRGYIASLSENLRQALGLLTLTARGSVELPIDKVPCRPAKDQRLDLGDSACKADALPVNDSGHGSNLGSARRRTKTKVMVSQAVSSENQSMESPAAPASTNVDEEEEAMCFICMEWLTDPVTLDCGHNYCRSCITDYCEIWEQLRVGGLECPLCKALIKNWNFRPSGELADTGERIKLLALNEEGKDLCVKHQEKLHLFCKEDQELVCLYCERSPEHESHTLVLKEEAAQEYKERILNFLEILRKGREDAPAYVEVIGKETRDLLERVRTEKQKLVAEFQKLRKFLEEQENNQVEQMIKVKEELEKKKEELSSHDSIIQEMEKKYQEPENELLKDIKNTMQRFEKKVMSENRVPSPPELKWKIWEFCDINPFLEGIFKQFKGILTAGLKLQKENVILDPDTAHPRLFLSEDHKSVRNGNHQSLPDNPERFDTRPYVLGCEGFTAGRHFWEVIVGSSEQWAVGVARKSVKRKGMVIAHLDEGIWEMGQWGLHYRDSIPLNKPLSLSEKPKRIRVSVNCEGGRVAFYDADEAALLYTHSAAFSGETLLPLFYVFWKAHLTLSAPG